MNLPSLAPQHILNARERRCIREIERKTNKACDGASNTAIYELSLAEYRQIAQLCERALQRMIGLESGMWLRVTLPDGVVHEFTLDAVYPERGLRTWQFNAWECVGFKLRKDGLPGKVRGSTDFHFSQARIERRALDGGWVVLADTVSP